MEKGSISICFVQAALAPVLARGLDAADVLREAGISPELLAAPHTRITAQSFGILWLGVARLLDDELFGQDARRMKVGSFAMLCRTLVHCATLGEALRCMARFFNLLLDDFECRLETDASHARLLVRDRSARPPMVFGYETLLLMQHSLACWLVGRRIPVLSAGFAYDEPAHSAEYLRMYSETLSYGQSATTLAFDRAFLALPVVQSVRTMREFVRGAPANIVLKYKNRSGLAAQLRRRLRGAAGSGAPWPDFDTLADALHMTPATLRRRLEDEGQSFQAIKDQLRRDLSIQALCHTDKNVAEIAQELGFAEPSAFHRAFKKWTGANPAAYRQRMQRQS